MDDSAIYTGVDGVQDGVFGNEKKDDETQRLLDEQKKLLAELTPTLERIVDMLDQEKAVMIEFIAKYVDESKDSDELYRAELKGAALYRNYLDELKTKFALALNETNGKK